MARLEEQSGPINTIFCQGELHVVYFYSAACQNHPRSPNVLMAL